MDFFYLFVKIIMGTNLGIVSDLPYLSAPPQSKDQNQTTKSLLDTTPYCSIAVQGEGFIILNLLLRFLGVQKMPEQQGC